MTKKLTTYIRYSVLIIFIFFSEGQYLSDSQGRQEKETFFSLFMPFIFCSLFNSDDEKRITKYYFTQHHFRITQYCKEKLHR